MGTLPTDTRYNYPALRKALREEYSLYTDEASATLSAMNILQKKNKSPRVYYRRLRTTYFGGCRTPGLEDDRAFKSLFLHNLHESIRYEVTMHRRSHDLSMKEVKKYAQFAWETRRPQTGGRKGDTRVLGIQTSQNDILTLEGKELPRAKTEGRTRPQRHQSPPPQNVRRNQRDDDYIPRQEPTRPQQRGNFPQKGKDRFNRNPRQGYQDRKGRGDTRVPPIGKDQQPDMEKLIRKFTTEVVKQLDVLRRPSGPPDSPKEPDSGNPST